MSEFLRSFSHYVETAQFNTMVFWLFPLITLLSIWLFTTIGLKLVARKRKLTTVFIIHRAWIVSALLVAMVWVGMICYWWATSWFAEHPWQLTLLFSLFIALLVPVVVLYRLRNHYSRDGLKALAPFAITPFQFDQRMVFTRRAFGKNKWYYLIPLLGFTMLLFALYKGQNMIAIVYDNSQSMEKTAAIDALAETFNSLQENNEIILTTLEGYVFEELETTSYSLAQVMDKSNSDDLKGGQVTLYNTPQLALDGVHQITNECIGSPIGEAIWKTYLFLEETKSDQPYSNQLLIALTDGQDSFLESPNAGEFFFDHEGFNIRFPVENVYMIDYSEAAPAPLMQRFQDAGAEVFAAENNKAAYLDAFDNALQTFKGNGFLVYWTLLIVVVHTLVGLLISPKKII